MKKSTLALLFAALAVAPLGCGNQTSPAPSSSAAKSRREAVPLREAQRTSRYIEDEEDTIEYQARQAKREIDNLAAEAESALRKSRQRLKSDALKRAQELAEYAAELAEEAKDRAEDLPLTLDRVLDMQFEDEPPSRLHRTRYDEETSLRHESRRDR